MSNPEIHGTVDYCGFIYTIYRDVGNPQDVNPFYYGIAKGEWKKDFDTPPYCAYSSIKSLFAAKGWSMRTPWTPVQPDCDHPEWSKESRDNNWRSSCTRCGIRAEGSCQ